MYSVPVAAQIPNNLAMHLHEGGAKILGTTPEMIDNAEDRWVAWGAVVFFFGVVGDARYRDFFLVRDFFSFCGESLLCGEL